jgi:hypothetical protein
MAKPPKIVCIGAGSAVFGLSNLATIVRSKRLRGAELALVDIDEAGLKTMTKLAHMMNQTWDSQMTIASTTDREEALSGADFGRLRAGRPTRRSVGVGLEDPPQARRAPALCRKLWPGGFRPHGPQCPADPRHRVGYGTLVP